MLSPIWNCSSLLPPAFADCHWDLRAVTSVKVSFWNDADFFTTSTKFGIKSALL